MLIRIFIYINIDKYTYIYIYIYKYISVYVIRTPKKIFTFVDPSFCCDLLPNVFPNFIPFRIATLNRYFVFV